MDLRKLAVSCVVLAIGLVAPVAASAATFTVNTTTDGSEVGGCETAPNCSLRDALLAAQTSPDPLNIVNVPAGHYELTLGELDLSGGEAVIVRGAGARVTTIDAQGNSRILDFSGGKLTVEGVTLTGGVADETISSAEFAGDGGAILARSSEPLTVVRSTISGNRATQNGAGISAPPESAVGTTVTVLESTVSGNQVTGGLVEGLGGGIYALGNLELVNSTVSGNSVENTALGTLQGGGVLVGTGPSNTEGTTVSILNSTIAGNSAATGGLGGGLAVYNLGTGVVGLTAKNTIVAANTAGGAAGDCALGALVASANNLSSDASCQFADAGSKQNTNPLLGALQNNGGPTDTMALAAGSPAIDAGTNAGCPAADQRGIARPQGAACDIGAFEREAAPPAPPATAASADLKLTLKAKPKRPKAGGKFKFVLKVADRGPDAATAVIVSGTVPALARSVKGPKVNGKRACKLAKAKKGKRKLTCRLGTVASGKSRTVRIVVGAGPKARKLRASASARSAVADPRPKNSRAKAVAKVVVR
jgi:CSLREA domain-containing protein